MTLNIEEAPMRPILLFTALAASAAILAACGGGSDSKDQPSPTIPVATAQPTATKAGGSQTTPVSANGTVSATTAAASATTAPSTTPAQSPTAAPTTAAQPTQPPANTAVATAVPSTPTPPPASNNPTSASIGVTGTVRFFWAPSAVTIAPGGTVTWAWSEPVQSHNVAGTDFAFGPTEITKTGSASYTFTTPGTYHFYCEVHPDTMRGTVTVQ